VITQAPGRRGGPRLRAASIGGAALMIGVITIASRLVGFGRQVVFAHSVGTTCLGTAYTTANMAPNIIYNIAAGGALTAIVVPVLARPAGAGDDEDEADPARASRIASALLTWTVLLLVPVSLGVALFARPLAGALLGSAAGCPRAAMNQVAGQMLVVFAPQVLLYGIAVVLYGILQAHRKFGGPAVAPLLSSLVVVGAYAAFGLTGGAYVNRLTALPALPEFLLAGGTTFGVLAMVAAAALPAWRLRLRLRPAVRFPPGVASRVRRLAVAGLLTLLAQDASTAVVIVLANRYGPAGTLVIYGFAWAVFVVPYAVLAVPIATSAFPELSARSGTGPAAGAALSDDGAVPDDIAFAATSAASTRAVLIACWLGAAVLIGARIPLARVFEDDSGPGAAELAAALAAFAPGLIGYGLSANLSRVLYAHGRNRAPAVAVSLGWLLVIAADAAAVPFVPRRWVVPVLGAGTSLGLTAAGLLLLIMVRRVRGPGALAGVTRAAAAGLAGCVTGAAAGEGASVLLAGGGLAVNAGLSVLVCSLVALVFAAIVWNVDGGDLRAVATRLRARAPVA
jgi:putative peptidoglycan lipid II flippase